MKFSPSPNEFFSNFGYCPCCDQPVKFVAKDSWFRDNYLCTSCSSLPRERALIYWLQVFFPGWQGFSIHESSPIFRGASLRLRTGCEKYVGSYFFPDRPTEEEVNGFFNINLERQSFGDATFDLVITQDVFEHLYDPSSAFREISRTLRKGGAHVFTVPLVNKGRPTQQWSEKKEDGSIHFFYEKEYHGDPVNDAGSAVAWHWGFDICQFIQKTTGMSSVILLKEDLSLGLQAEYLEVVISFKI